MIYTPIFDITREPYPWQWLSVSLIASVIVLSLLTIWVRRRSSTERVSVVVIALWVLALFAAVVSGLSLYRYWHLSGMLKDGKCQVVEGVVAAFSPMPPQGHAEESFSVAGVRFGYYPQLFDPAFHVTAVDGGPIREGLRVRIAHFEGKILRLEAATAEPSGIGKE